MIRNKVHIAVLETDVPGQAVYVKRGLYSSQFRVLLTAAAERLNQNPGNLKHGPIDVRVTAFDVVGGLLPHLEELRTESHTCNGTDCSKSPRPIDAILVTSAAAAAYDDLHWIPALESFIQTVHNKYPLVKMFGSCFGHQLIGQALLEKSPSLILKELSTKFSVQAQPIHEIGVQSITLHPAFASRFAPLARFKQREPFRLQLIHGDVVAPSPLPLKEAELLNACLPEPWINIGSTGKCLIQGLYYPGRVLTLQGHFEFDAFATAELCLQFSRKFAWPSDLLASHLDGIWRASWNGEEDDSKVAAEAVLLFFAGED
ncbi:hypothetical protein N7476_004503 [Penicillium atrosanguineum]|uniref:Class I glutamine amidotransferase-like protein n=1 Tax=Penicillium atrosanguineum TaxID=1132637 RepID=A0A9W9Q066_9EURO|nr:hypothetical protein N7476_004503 [Penicillium atrosanguineum]